MKEEIFHRVKFQLTYHISSDTEFGFKILGCIPESKQSITT